MAYTETTSGAQFSVNQAVTATADSTNVFDVTGAGVGNAPAMIGAGGVNTAMGFDVGAGEGPAVPQVQIAVITSTTATGSLQISLSAAPDNGSYSAGTYVPVYESAPLTGAQLAKGAVLTFQVPPIPPALLLPRFYKLTYTVVSGSISLVVDANLLINAPLVRDVTLYGSNFVAI